MPGIPGGRLLPGCAGMTICAGAGNEANQYHWSMDMDVFEAIHTRKSIRSFLDREISDEIVKRILRAGIRAPSGGNRQPWRFVVVRNREKIQQFDPEFHQPCVENAPAVIVACANPHDTWEKYDEEDHCYVLDTAAAIQNMLLAIHGLGLGGVWILNCRKKTIRKLLDIPLHWRIISIIPFGYYQPEDQTGYQEKLIQNAKPRPCKPLSEVAYLENTHNPLVVEE